ncbi:hypothetical protein SNEBB_005692 [Seison nebaliae]|nr:hypothetical protein SNEBB_005692 [Seison nebaliae]
MKTKDINRRKCVKSESLNIDSKKMNFSTKSYQRSAVQSIPKKNTNLLNEPSILKQLVSEIDRKFPEEKDKEFNDSDLAYLMFLVREKNYESDALLKKLSRSAFDYRTNQNVEPEIKERYQLRNFLMKQILYCVDLLGKLGYHSLTDFWKHYISLSLNSAPQMMRMMEEMENMNQQLFQVAISDIDVKNLGKYHKELREMPKKDVEEKLRNSLRFIGQLKITDDMPLPKDNKENNEMNGRDIGNE